MRRGSPHLTYAPQPIELPPAVALAFVRDMKAFFAEQDPIKRDAIAAEQMTALQKYQGPREKPLRLIDVKEMFSQLWDET